MKTLKKMMSLFVLIAMGFGLFGCDEAENAVDEVGDAMGQAVDEAGDAAQEVESEIDQAL